MWSVCCVPSMVLEDMQPESPRVTVWLVHGMIKACPQFFSLCYCSPQYFPRCTFQPLLQGSISWENHGLLSFAIFSLKSLPIPLFGANYFIPSVFQGTSYFTFLSQLFLFMCLFPTRFQVPWCHGFIWILSSLFLMMLAKCLFHSWCSKKVYNMKSDWIKIMFYLNCSGTQIYAVEPSWILVSILNLFSLCSGKFNAQSPIPEQINYYHHFLLPFPVLYVYKHNFYESMSIGS